MISEGFEPSTSVKTPDPRSGGIASYPTEQCVIGVGFEPTREHPVFSIGIEPIPTARPACLPISNIQSILKNFITTKNPKLFWFRVCLFVLIFYITKITILLLSNK